MTKPEFVVVQEADGRWTYYSDDDTSFRLPWIEGCLTREEAERKAERFAYRLQKGDETEQQIKERLMPLIQAWADEMVRETGLELEEVLLDIGNGVRQARKAVCPDG